MEIDTFYCAGGEPLWEMSVQSGQGRFGTVLDGARPVVGGPAAIPGDAPSWRGRTSDGVELVLRFDRAACTSALLQAPAEHRAVLVVDGEARLGGCCRLRLDGAAVAHGDRAPASGAMAQDVTAPRVAVARIRAKPGSMVNVREQPRIDPDNVVAQLPAGASIALAGAETSEGRLWYRVRLARNAGGGWVRGGWVRGDLVELAPASTAQASWEMRPELIPAIDRCLEEMAASPALVTLAHSDANGGIGIRLMDAEGRRWACIGDVAGSTGPELTLLPADDRLPGEFRPLFLRAPDEPTRDPCYRHEPLRDDAGRITGWLSFGLCS